VLDCLKLYAGLYQRLSACCVCNRAESDNDETWRPLWTETRTCS